MALQSTRSKPNREIPLAHSSRAKRITAETRGGGESLAHLRRDCEEEWIRRVTADIIAPHLSCDLANGEEEKLGGGGVGRAQR
jgi:hypothetical protein